MTALRRFREDRPKVEAAPWIAIKVDPVRFASAENYRALTPRSRISGTDSFPVHAYRYEAFQIRNLDKQRLGHVEFTADLKTYDAARLPGLEGLQYAANSLIEGDVSSSAYSEAVRLLDIVRATSISNLPAPDIGVSEDGVSLGWTRDNQIVLVSVEGDGEAAYAYNVGDRFQPGKEVFTLDREHLPDDLRNYLQSMYS